MFSLYDLAEIGACFASFFTMLFVLVRKPGHVSAHLYVVAAISTFLLWTSFILIIPKPSPTPLWQHGILMALLAITSALWLMFLLVFARESTSNIFRGRSTTVYVLLTLFIVAAIVGFVSPYFRIHFDQTGERFFEITPFGKYFLVLLIISYTFCLLQLESTYRASLGQLRRALVPSLLIIGTSLAVLLVSSMMGLLYSRIDFISIQLCALASIGAMVLASRFLVFEEITGQRVVISREAVYSSVAVLLVGSYFILIGLAVWLLVKLGGSPSIFFSVLAAFVVIVIIVALFFSSSIRSRWRGIVDRSIYSGRLELLTDISTFAEEVSIATDKREMFDAIVEVLKQKCLMTDVVLALRGNRQGEFEYGYPTESLRTLHLPGVDDWLFRASKMTGKVEMLSNPAEFSQPEIEFLSNVAGSYLIPLMARKELVGFISCTSAVPISPEARFFIDSISHQLALSLLSARQSEILIENRELASFTKVSSFVIHDVKNLISMLSMILQNAEKKFDDPRFQQMTVDTLRGAQERMKRMISRLTAPAAQTEFVLGDCDLRRLLLDLAEEMKLSSQRKIAANIDPGETPLVKGNVDKLKSVISNLLINAIEAMPAGGEIHVTSAAEGDMVAFMFRDTGVGMTQEFIRDKLFRPFRTSKASGLGIGLFQSKELVEQMGGRLSVTSAAGEGTCFILRLRKS